MRRAGEANRAGWASSGEMRAGRGAVNGENPAGFHSLGVLVGSASNGEVSYRQQSQVAASQHTSLGEPSCSHGEPPHLIQAGGRVCGGGSVSMVQASL